MPDHIVAPFGSWPSPITSDLVAGESVSLLDVLLDGEDVYWVEGRPQEAGRCVLVRWQRNGTPLDINPPPLNARTRVHEYGGGGVLVANAAAYFSNFKDQRLYQVRLGQEPSPLTPDIEGSVLRYADGRIDRVRNLWIGVREDHRDGSKEAVTAIVSVDPTTGGEGTVLVAGNDFYSSPRLSPDGRHLAWLTWNHPNMPWMGTELWIGEVTASGVNNTVRVAGGPSESVFQPEWAPDGRLYFVSDRSGWWNLHRQEQDGSVMAVCVRDAEFGQPQWQFGMSTYAFLSAEEAVCSYTERGVGRLARLDLASGALTPFDLPFTEYATVRAEGGRVAFRAGSPTLPASVVLLDWKTGAVTTLRKANTVADDAEIKKYLSVPDRVEFPTTGGRTAFGLYYPPHNPDASAPDGDRPPLLVKCHGGPTASASHTLDLRIQFWTSRGVAVIDVDYGGSTGYGREYRNRLQLNWGVVDVDDCAAAVRYLGQRELADADRAVITGGSAGGFTTLACLAFRDVFRAGASHYGVSDLEAIVHDTHKFESRYLDWLIGPYPEAKDIYRQRSPLYHADKLSVPVVFFQGDEDRVVHPKQAALMVDALRRKGIPVGYLLFTGEQHGFRQARNIKRALDAELYFFAALAFRVGLQF